MVGRDCEEWKRGKFWGFEKVSVRLRSRIATVSGSKARSRSENPASIGQFGVFEVKVEDYEQEFHN